MLYDSLLSTEMPMETHLFDHADDMVALIAARESEDFNHKSCKLTVTCKPVFRTWVNFDGKLLGGLDSACKSLYECRVS